MNYESIVLAMISALPPTLTALAALIVGVRSGKRTKEIYTVVNGNFAALTEELRHTKALLLEAVGNGKLAPLP